MVICIKQVRCALFHSVVKQNCGDYALESYFLGVVQAIIE